MRVQGIFNRMLFGLCFLKETEINLLLLFLFCPLSKPLEYYNWNVERMFKKSWRGESMNKTIKKSSFVLWNMLCEEQQREWLPGPCSTGQSDWLMVSVQSSSHQEAETLYSWSPPLVLVQCFPHGYSGGIPLGWVVLVLTVTCPKGLLQEPNHSSFSTQYNMKLCL